MKIVYMRLLISHQKILNMRRLKLKVKLKMSFKTFKNIINIFLHGDFNSRTSKEPDVFNFERESGNDENVEHLFIVTSNEYRLEELGIPLRRANEDKVINQYVRKLLNFCKYIDVFILNGRIGEDKDIGKFTCKNVGVVDYTIASPGYLKHITNFQVLEFSKLLSDVHCQYILLLVMLNNIHV